MEVRPENPNEQPLVKQGPTIPELYSRADAAAPNSSFDHSQFTPQVLITFHFMHWTLWHWLQTGEGGTLSFWSHYMWLCALLGHCAV